MSENGEIFSNQVPGLKRAHVPRAQQAPAPPREAAPISQVEHTQEAKPKRPYNRKSPPPPAAAASPRTTGAIGSAPGQTSASPAVPDPAVEKRFGSRGLEYIQALTRLLELLPQPSRERLVAFIIDAKIV